MAEAASHKSFGEFLKQKRLDRGWTLRQFCIEHRIDAGNLSKIERGLLPPPQGEKLREYAAYLGIEEGTDDWYELYDLSAAERGQIPDDLRDDERLVKKLPVLFRGLRGHRVDDEDLRELARRLREE